MLDHVSIGVRDIGRTRGFYDSVFAPLGYRCLSAGETSLGYGKDYGDAYYAAFVIDPDGYRIEAYCGRPE